MRDTRYEIGSALILAVVLTSLLAIVAVMFLMAARVDKVATSAISENRELNFAVETVIAKISDELALDVPGLPKGNEYYDYPDVNNAWLASLEPYDAAGIYKWRQISDVYDKLGPNLELSAEIIPDYQDTVSEGLKADADGDGVADSVWVKLDGITSGKGKPIYAAIRIIDNGGMLNVNTAYKFDPTGSRERVDGSSQTQINLAALSQRGSNGTLDEAADDLHDVRCNGDGSGVLISEYEQDVVWQYYKPRGEYTPFDISDELKLHNRYILNYNLMVSRIEELWENAYDGPLYVPRTSGTRLRNDPNYWFWYTNNSSLDANDYDYRHISTTYNMDRVIDPNGKKMVNVNEANAVSIYNTIRIAFSANSAFVDVNDVAAQMAVNLIDFRDNDSNVTTIDVGADTYYGFERPCIYISELAHKFVEVPAPIPGEPNTIYKSYAIELYKPYPGDSDPNKNDWQLVIDGNPIAIDWSLGSKRFNVILFEDPAMPSAEKLEQEVDFGSVDPNYGGLPYNAVYDDHFDGNSDLFLQRLVADVNDYIVVDRKLVPPASGDWLATDGIAHSIQRDITRHKCIRRLWASVPLDPNLGHSNSYVSAGAPIQAHPANQSFTNIGEIGAVFREDAYSRIGYSADTDEEAEVRIDLTDPNFQEVFKYLTVWPPSSYVPDPNETRIKGRININTAPWYVIAQLPWMQYDPATPFKRAQNICDYRDDTLGGFENIAELMLVAEVKSLGSDGEDNLNTGDPKGPDITTDSARDDFEERDLIFARISNLVTVRSDVFTAYILVRIGRDGPQKRAIAILDRSNVYSPDDKVRIVALHPVPDPR